MTDNVSLTPGGASGALASTEELTTLNGATVLAQHAQRLILALRAADGVGVDVSSANPLPVGGTLALDAPTLAALETIQVALDATSLAALETIQVGNDPATQTTLVAVLAAVTALQAGTPAEPMSVGPFSTSRGYRQATSTVTATLLSTLIGGLPTGASKVLLRPSAEIRIRDDATSPTATVGYPIPAGTEWVYDGDLLPALKLVKAATVDCWFFS